MPRELWIIRSTCKAVNVVIPPLHTIQLTGHGLRCTCLINNTFYHSLLYPQLLQAYTPLCSICLALLVTTSEELRCPMRLHKAISIASVLKRMAMSFVLPKSQAICARQANLSHGSLPHSVQVLKMRGRVKRRRCNGALSASLFVNVNTPMLRVYKKSYKFPVFGG